MTSLDLIPFGAEAQRAVERQWLAAVRDHALPGGVRTAVRSSWERSLGAAVPPDLREAPVVLDASALVDAVETTDWLDLARARMAEHEQSFAGAGHILTLFDHEARMLSAEGDPAALEGLADIDFRPGALWSEHVVGTNGPGTALATGSAVHIVGAEHFCARWQRWHCAAVPIRELSTGRSLGVLDVSGFRDQAHPHTLNLALALALAIEQSVAAREIERRYLVVTRLTHLSQRYPADGVVAVDRRGRILLASPAAPTELSPGREDPALRALVPELVGRTRDPLPQEVALAGDAGGGARRGVWHPVLEGHTVVGGCLVLEHRETGARPRARKAPGRLGSPRHTFADIVGESPACRSARQAALAAAGTDLPVLLLGEPGTGAELFAQAIHQAGSRRDRPFLAANCAALSRRQIEAAGEGTLFLAELGDLPPAAQATLLRALEEGEDVRIIGATSRDPAALLASGFAPALYRAISVMRVQLHPLRARREDLPALAGRLFETVARDLGRPEVVVDPEVLTAFQAYAWPGNLRELRNVVRRLMVFAGHTIGVADLPQAIRAAHYGNAMVPAPLAPTSPIDLEDARLMEVINRSHTMADAAAELGVTRSTLYRRMERFGLRPKRVVDRE
jgi:transcriptional regulator of acetoin/glycerol metabolism